MSESKLYPIQSLLTTQTICSIYNELKNSLNQFDEVKNLSALLGSGNQFDLLLKMKFNQENQIKIFDKTVACKYILASFLYQNSDDKKNTCIL